MQAVNIREADSVEITILMDNYTDMLVTESTEVCKRPHVPFPQNLLAEHGLSCLIKVCKGNEEHLVLMDAAVTSACLFNNAEVLKTELEKTEAVVLSHGHPDHFLGLIDLLKLLQETQKNVQNSQNLKNTQDKKIPLFLHPDAFLERRINIPAVGHPVTIPALNKEELIDAGACLVESKKPSSIANDLIYTTGEVERTTMFEHGFPWAEAKINEEWVLDPFMDDQGLIIKLKDKGLVVISGCAHAGIVNTVRYAQKITGTDKLHAVLGGFHLTGKLFDPIIQPTIEEMKKINPDFVVPMHCTGWSAINRFSEEMPDKFLLNTVGTTYVFK